MHDDAHFMTLALAQGQLAAHAGEVPVGAVVVKDGQVLAVGRNAPIALHDPSAHAEVQALRAAAQALGNYRLDGCELFVTLEPCAMCAGAMLHARLQRVVFGASDPKTGAAGSVLNLFAQPQLNHQTQVVGGVLQAPCGRALQDFFREKRQRDPANAAEFPLREDALRTPQERFAALVDFPWQAHYVHDVPALGGLRMHYLDEGPADAALVFLCLHGRADWGYLFRRMLPVWVAAGHRVLVPDLVGYGKSDKPKRESAHTPQLHQQCLEQLLDQLDLRHVVLVVQAADALGASVLPLGATQRLKGLLQVQLLASAQEEIQVAEQAAYASPYPDAGHRAALRAFPLGRSQAPNLVEGAQAKMPAAFSARDLGRVFADNAASCAQGALSFFTAG